MKMINTIEKQHNYNMIDLCKFIGAYIVIAYHSNPVVNCPDSIWATLLQMVLDLTVPFYFMSTGFFLYIKINDDKFEKVRRVNSYAKKIIKLYCITTFISFPLTVYGYVVSENSIISCILSYIKYFFFVGKLYNSYHLWYLLSVIYFLVILRIMISVNTKEEQIFMVSFLFYVFFEIMWFVVQNIDSFSGISYKTIGLYEFIFNNGMIFSGFIYISIGILIAKYKKYFNKWICFVCVITLTILSYHLPQVINDGLRVLAVTFLFMGMLGIRLKNRSCYPFMRKMSMMIYLSHLIFLSIYTFLIIKEPNKYGVDTFIVTSVACTVFAYVYAIDIKSIVEKIMYRNED